MTTSTERKLVSEYDRGRVTDLLDRYPDIGGEEIAVILRFLKKAPQLEIGLLGSDDRVKPKLDRFRADHAREFSVGPMGLLVAFSIIAGLVAVCVLLWDAGVGN